jgi:hypothetical protein
VTKLEQLSDHFDRADTAKWTFSTGASAQAGRLKLVSQLDPDAASVTSVASWDATDSHLLTETVQGVGSGVSHELRISLYAAAGSATTNAVEWKVSTAFGIESAVWIAGVRTVVDTLPYDAFSHRWLRIREAAGTVRWEASPDGLEWATLATRATPFVMTAVRVLLSASYWAPGDFAGTWLLDNVNTHLGDSDPVTLTGDDGLPYLAIDVQPDVAAGFFTLDTSHLDGTDVLAWSDADPGAWLNIVCDVQQLNYRRGAARLQGLLTQTEAGTATITLSDTAGTFDPMTNTDVIHKGTPLRVRAWGTDGDGARWDVVLFTAEVDQVFVQYLNDDVPAVTLTGVDLVGPLAAWQSAGEDAPGLGAGEDLRARVKRTLAAVGRGVLSPHCDESYTATLAPTLLARPWQELQQAVEAELGRLWVDRHNRLIVQNRDSVLGGTVRGTLSDVHGEAPVGVHCCVAAAQVVYGVENMANRAIGTRVPAAGDSPATMQSDDETSQARYGTGTVERSSLPLQTDGQVQAWADAVVAAQSRPELRVDSVQPAPPPDDLGTALAAWPAVLATDLGDRWLFLFRPFSGQLVEQTVGVLGIEVDATPDAWTVTWTTAAATPAGTAPGGWFTLNTSALNGNDLLERPGVSV